MSDYLDLLQKYNDVLESRNNARSTYYSCNNQIESLRTAKGQIYDEMATIYDVSDKFSEHFTTYDGEWNGQTHNDASSYVNDTIVADINQYYNSLLELLGDIDNKISELETERDSNSNIIQLMGNKLSDLWYDMTHDTSK